MPQEGRSLDAEWLVGTTGPRGWAKPGRGGHRPGGAELTCDWEHSSGPARLGGLQNTPRLIRRVPLKCACLLLSGKVGRPSERLGEAEAAGWMGRLPWAGGLPPSPSLSTVREAGPFRACLSVRPALRVSPCRASQDRTQPSPRGRTGAAMGPGAGRATRCSRARGGQAGVRLSPDVDSCAHGKSPRDASGNDAFPIKTSKTATLSKLSFSPQCDDTQRQTKCPPDWDRASWGFPELMGGTLTRLGCREACPSSPGHRGPPRCPLQGTMGSLSLHEQRPA